MARMVPFPMLPTESSAERRLYELFLVQLPDDYVVYHSVDWVLAPSEPGGTPVQGESDFLIAHPVYGLLVVEVKGGTVEYESTSRRWFQKGRGGRHALSKDPFDQARDEMRSLVEILRQQPGWDRWRPSHGYGVAFPDARYDHDPHGGGPPEIAIDQDDLDHLNDRVADVMRFWRRPGRTFGRPGMEALQRALGFRLEVPTPLRFPFDEEDRKIVELTDDQKYVLAYVARRRRAAVVGPAGSGKTMLATQLASRLAAGGDRTLFTCVTRRLAMHLREAVGEPQNLDVVDFHELCVRMATEAGVEIPSAGAIDTEALAESLVPLARVLGRAAEILGPRYTAMVVDEVQDFHPDWWPGLLALHTEPERGRLFLFLDDNQNISGGEVPEGLTDATVALTGNLRSTQPIHEFVSVFHRGPVPPVGKGARGTPVEVLGYRDLDDLARLLALVIENLRAEGVSLRDIVVLTPAEASQSALRKRGRVNGFPLSEEPAEGEVLASTVHGFKGLETSVVILAELGEPHDDLATYLYVGGTRARDHLIVLAAEPVAKKLRLLAGVAPG
jgi:hypothetical protein